MLEILLENAEDKSEMLELPGEVRGEKEAAKQGVAEVCTVDCSSQPAAAEADMICS